MKIKSITFLLAYLLLFILAIPAIAWDCEDPKPGDCYECEDGDWVQYGDCWGWGGCPPCNSCVNCWCEYQCNSGQKCCEGSCCDKIWTTYITDPIETFCPSCGNGPPGEGLCGGTGTVLESYEHCVAAEAGQGEACQCNETWQTVGYTYSCMINWDISKMAWCAFQTGWCIAECILFMEPAGCSNCLMGIDCCGGPCEMCDFVETCEKSANMVEEQKSLVFSDFDCEQF